METILKGYSRVKKQIERAETVYMGPCVVQSPGAWTRLGPTWKTPVGYYTYGPGVKEWGTTMGLAELAAQSTAKPELHSVGWSCSPEPNIIFAMSEWGLKTKGLEDVKKISEGIANEY